MPDKSPKHRVRHAGHGSQNRPGRYQHRPDPHFRRHTNPFGHRMFDGIVPVLLYRESLAGHLLPRSQITLAIPQPDIQTASLLNPGSNLPPLRVECVLLSFSVEYVVAEARFGSTSASAS